MLFDMSLWGRGRRRSGQPLRVLALTASTVAENATPGTVVGAFLGKMPGSTLSVLTQSQTGWFGVSGASLTVAGTLDYETAQSPTVTIRETIPGQPPKDTAFAITVTNVLEVTLAALSLDDLTIAEDQPEGTLVGNITGASSGSTVTLLTQSNAGMFAKDGNAIEVGTTALDFETAPAPTITLRETHLDASNSPRDSVIAITATDVSEGGGLFPDEDLSDTGNPALWDFTGDTTGNLQPAEGTGPDILVNGSFGGPTDTDIVGLAGAHETAFNAAVADNSTKTVKITHDVGAFGTIGSIRARMKEGPWITFTFTSGSPFQTHDLTAGAGSGFDISGVGGGSTLVGVLTDIEVS